MEAKSGGSLGEEQDTPNNYDGAIEIEKYQKKSFIQRYSREKIVLGGFSSSDLF
jgi:hypothetical protein